MCSCVGYTENQIFDLLQDEFQKNLPIIIISQCVLCSIQNSKPGRVVVVNFKRFLNFFREIKSIYFTKNSMDFCEISMLLLLSTYLQVLEMCRVVCFNIMVEKFQLPAVGYLPWPLPTSNFKKNSKFKNLHTQNRKNPRNCYYYNILSPVGLVIFVSSESKFLSYIIIQSCDLYYKIIIIFYLGFKKTGCRRRNVLKEDLVAEDLNPEVGELFWARLPGYGQKKPEVPMGAWVSNGLDYYGNLV